MTQDRRRYPRYPVLIHCALVFGHERREMFCTQVGPAAGFVGGRVDGLPVGMVVSVDMRPGGLGAAAILLQGEIVRIALGAGGLPTGCAIRWKTVSCELGVGPLLHFVAKVLRVAYVGQPDVAAGRQAEFDLEAFVSGRPARVRSSARSSDVFAAETKHLYLAQSARQGPRLPQAGSPAGLNLGLSNQLPASNQRNVGGTISRGAQAMARDEPTGQLEPIMLREAMERYPLSGRRSPSNRRTAAVVLPLQHVGGPVMEGVDRSAASAAAEADAATLPRDMLPPLPDLAPDPVASADQEPEPTAAPMAALSTPPAQPAAPMAALSTPPAQPATTATAAYGAVAGRMAQPAGAPPFAALGPDLIAPARAQLSRVPSVAEPVLPPITVGAGEPPTPSETSSAFDWRGSPVPQIPPEAPNPHGHAEPESIAVSKPVVPPAVLNTNISLSGSQYGNEASGVSGPPMQPPAHMPDDNLSKSWPVYALAPGERRTDPAEDDAEVPDLLGAGIEMTGEPTETVPKAPVTDNLGARPVERPEMAVMRKKPSRRNDVHQMVAATIPVTYEYRSRQGRGLVIAISTQAVAVVTTDDAPQLDEQVVLHLPLADRTGPIIIHLCGKLLQVMTETEQGPRFVLHIERVEEGQAKGAFLRALNDLAQA
ncbi:MAG: hypothetical protein EXR77_04585 [Myxococcales bacterium]|nr:hypothetical protein [Myxococcales bacterium]